MPLDPRESPEAYKHSPVRCFFRLSEAKNMVGTGYITKQLDGRLIQSYKQVKNGWSYKNVRCIFVYTVNGKPKSKVLELDIGSMKARPTSTPDMQPLYAAEDPLWAPYCEYKKHLSQLQSNQGPSNDSPNTCEGLVEHQLPIT